MIERTYLQTPGPISVPDQVLRSMSIEQVSHKGQVFKEVLKDCIGGLKKVLRTENDILLFPSSGSGALESSIVNMFSPGDRILGFSNGTFSERICSIARSFGIEVIQIEKEWGQAIKREDVEKVLKEDKDKKIKGVYLPHNETSTGTVNDIKNISKSIKDLKHPALLMADCISSMASIPFETDKWEVDIVVTTTQKGLMVPPGIGIVSVSKKAWNFYEKSKCPKWYWDYGKVKDNFKELNFPYTPPTAIYFGLQKSLEMILQEGIENVWARHRILAEALRESLKTINLEIIAEEGYESNSVSAIKMPEGVTFKDLKEKLDKKYNVIIANGLTKLEDKVFRIGHMGRISKLDIYAVMGALEMSLYELGLDIKLGSTSKILENIMTKL